MNKLTTLSIVKRNGVKTLKADKTVDNPDIDQLLVDLGNMTRAIPFYVIYPGDGGAPITMDGLITPWRVFRALQQAGPSRNADRTETVLK